MTRHTSYKTYLKSLLIKIDPLRLIYFTRLLYQSKKLGKAIDQKCTTLSNQISYYFRWRIDLHSKRTFSWEKPQPYMAYATQDFFERQFLNKNMRVFEYGSGFSTVYFAQRTLSIHSIEYDIKWYQDVCKGISLQPNLNAKIECLAPSPCNEQNCNYRSSWPQFHDQCFENYAKSIHQYPNNYFDLVIVDGRSRVACALECAKHIKPGGFLLLDDSERPFYHSLFIHFKEWSSFSIGGPSPRQATFKRSTFWKKPNNS